MESQVKKTTNTRSLVWRKNKLYSGEKYTGFKVEEDSDKVFRVVYPDGVKSEDHYNLTWAKDNSRLEWSSRCVEQ